MSTKIQREKDNIAEELKRLETEHNQLKKQSTAKMADDDALIEAERKLNRTVADLKASENEKGKMKDEVDDLK